MLICLSSHSGLTAATADSVDPGESGLSSDMLMSIAMGGGGGGGGVGVDYSRYSVRHSIHIGLAPADLRLEPADEEMAKGSYVYVHNFWAFFLVRSGHETLSCTHMYYAVMCDVHILWCFLQL